MIKAPSQSIEQIQIALERSYQVSPFRLLIYLFWGLILAKCCLVQWAIIIYEVKINALFYVWIPSLIFSGACTVIYARISFSEFQKTPMMSRMVQAVWGSCGLCFAIFTCVGVFFQGIEIHALPAFFACLMGAGYAIHSVLDQSTLFKFTAVGWWGCSLGLFYNDNYNNLAWLALAIVVLQSIPTIVTYSQSLKRVKQFIPH